MSAWAEQGPCSLPLSYEPSVYSGDSNENKPLVGAEEEEVAKMGCPSLGENTQLEVIIEESYEFKSTVDKLIKKTNLALVVGSSSWREQFVSAVTVSAGDDDEEESGEERLPSCFDYIMHFLTVFWKVLFAFVPPTEYWNGWACFFVSISLIGVLTAVTGDLASHFGCTIGLKDSVTAVVFVALGTSVPGETQWHHGFCAVFVTFHLFVLVLYINDISYSQNLVLVKLKCKDTIVPEV
ncbi:Sodium/calcium exchanger 1 [Xenotaenia resolanae]|uniref:Sodium/calcium exchanger 1 n=1 Tax=Xenotaenia resolanae TaxID=208358 RepID=A0ABV0WSD4_9TELE